MAADARHSQFVTKSVDKRKKKFYNKTKAVMGRSKQLARVREKAAGVSLSNAMLNVGPELQSGRLHISVAAV